MRNGPLTTLFVVVAATTIGSAAGQPAPADLTIVPQVPTTYMPKRTPWGDPDLRATWTGDQLSEAGIELERPVEQGNRLWLTEQEFAKRLAQAHESDSDRTEINAHLMPGGSNALATWMQSTPYGRRTSLIVSPANGRLPPLLPGAAELTKAGRSSWNKGQPIDWVSDLDALDRCVARGFPSVMLPSDRDSANGIRIFQAPGYVALQMEMLGTRIIPLEKGLPWSSSVRGWLGNGRGHWEGNTLVIETSNLVSGDSAAEDTSNRAASPASANSTIPVGPSARALERLTLTGPSTLVYEVTYTDLDVFSAPWKAQVEWKRDDKYRIYEFACHEGNVQVRDMINSSRAQRNTEASAVSIAGPTGPSVTDRP